MSRSCSRRFWRGGTSIGKTALAPPRATTSAPPVPAIGVADRVHHARAWSEVATRVAITSASWRRRLWDLGPIGVSGTWYPREMKGLPLAAARDVAGACGAFCRPRLGRDGRHLVSAGIMSESRWESPEVTEPGGHPCPVGPSLPTFSVTGRAARRSLRSPPRGRPWTSPASAPPRAASIGPRRRHGSSSTTSP